MSTILPLLVRAANVDNINHGPLPPHIAAEDKGPMIIATVCALTSTATVFVAARLYTRTRILGAVQADDWLIAASLAFTWAAAGLSVAANEHGAGRHVGALSPAQLRNAIFLTMLGFVPSLLSFALPKLAIVTLLTRLLNPGRTHKAFLWFLGGSCMVALVATLVVEFAQCVPVAALWDNTIPVEERRCWDPRVNVYCAYFSGSCSAFVDMYLAIYPALVLVRLQQMQWRKKLALSSALGLGVLASIVAIYKCTRLPSLGSKDYTYDTADLVIWTSIESNTLIIAACIPLLQPLIDRIFGRRFLRGSEADRPHASYTGDAYSRRTSWPLGSGASDRPPRASVTQAAHSHRDMRHVSPPRGRTSILHSSASARFNLGPSSPCTPPRRLKKQQQQRRRSAFGADVLHRGKAEDGAITTVGVLGRNDSQESIAWLGGAVSPTVATLSGHASPVTRSRGHSVASASAVPVLRQPYPPPPSSFGDLGGFYSVGGLVAIVPPAGRILRTDVVTVSYDTRMQKGVDSGRSARGMVGNRRGSDDLRSHHPRFWRP